MNFSDAVLTFAGVLALAISCAILAWAKSVVRRRNSRLGPAMTHSKNKNW